MRIKLPDWAKPSPKGVAENAMANTLLEVAYWLGRVLGPVIPAWPIVQYVAPSTNQGWVLWMLGTYVAITVGWAAVEFARTQRAQRTPAEPSPPPSTLTFTQQADKEGAKKSPIEFLIEGFWLNTPFRFTNIGMNERNDVVYCEDVYLTVRAKEFLDSVRVQFVVTMGNPERVHEHWHKGVFEGAVTPDMSESIRFFRRTFRLPRVAMAHEDNPNAFTHRSIRHEGEVILFDGTASEVRRVPWGILNVKVYVHHRGGRERGQLVIDTDRIHSPRSRLTVVDKITLPVSNNYLRPFGAAALYEENPP